MTKIVYNNVFDYINQNKDKLQIITTGNLGSDMSNGLFIFDSSNDSEKLIQEMLLKFLCISSEDIKYWLSLSRDDIENMKNIIEYKRLKSRLEDLEKIIK